MTSPAALVFSQPSQINNILLEASRLHLPVILHFPHETKSVRAVFQNASDSLQSLILNNISPLGDRLIQDYSEVEVELLLFSRKVSFKTKIKERATGNITCAFPLQIHFIERRSITRFPIKDKFTCFARFLDFSQTTYPPPTGNYVSSLKKKRPPILAVKDLSIEGIACSTFNGTYAELLKPDFPSYSIEICLPETPSILVTAERRWSKILKKDVDNPVVPTIDSVLALNPEFKARSPYSLQEYSFGFLMNVPTTRLEDLKTFLRLLQSQGSI